MIVKSMSNSEIVKELKTIEDALISRNKGYWKKFGKKLKSKAYKHCDVLGKGEYVINGNKVFVCFQKVVYTNKLYELVKNHIVLTEDNGAFISFRDGSGRFCFHHFTQHAVDRLWQRMRLTVKDFFVNEFVIKADTAHHLTKYDGYGYDDSTYIMSIGRCFFIVCTDDNKIVVKTTLDSDSIYTHQTIFYEDSKMCAGEYADKQDRARIDDTKRIGLKKLRNAVRVMRA